MFFVLLHVYLITPDGYTVCKLLSQLAMYYVAIDLVFTLSEQGDGNKGNNGHKGNTK